MEIAYSLRRLWQLRLWVAVAFVVALVGSIAVTQRISLSPLSLKAKPGIESGAASTALLVDSPRSAVGSLSSPVGPLTVRASLIALLIKSAPVRSEVAKELGISQRSMSTTVTIPNPWNPSIPPTLSAGARANTLVSETTKYQVSAQPEPEAPIVDIFTQAPNGRRAIALANATSMAVKRYVTQLQQGDAVPKLSRVQLRVLGEATGGDVNSGSGLLLSILAFFGIFFIGCLLILALSRIVHDIRIDRSLEEFEGVGLSEETVALREAEGESRRDGPPDHAPAGASHPASRFD